MNLTKREKQILTIIKIYMMENGTTPTIRDICREAGLRSPSSAHKYFIRLVDKGYIKQFDRGTCRYSVKGMKYVEVSDM